MTSKRRQVKSKKTCKKKNKTTKSTTFGYKLYQFLTMAFFQSNLNRRKLEIQMTEYFKRFLLDLYNKVY